VALWLPVYALGTLGDKGRIHLEVQPRINHNAGDLNQIVARYAIGRQITSRVVVLVGHALIPMFQPSLRYQQRLWQQVLLTSRAGKWTMGSRVRSEQRWLPDVDGPSHRLRGQLRITRPIHGKSPWSISMYEEVAVVLNSREGGPQRGFDRSRAYAGVGRQLRPALSMETGYTWETVARPNEPNLHNHILTVSVTSRFAW
jgi:hypothetical protein